MDTLPRHVLRELIIRVANTILEEEGRDAVRDPIFALAEQNFPVFRPVFRDPIFWESLTQRVWLRTVLRRESWEVEYDFWHQTARNFMQGEFTTRFTEAVPVVGNLHITALLCSCLAISDLCFAAGYVDGSVRVYDIESLTLLATFQGSPQQHEFRTSRVVSGIIIGEEDSFTFARYDGDIYSAPIIGPVCRPVVGDVPGRGILISFAGNGQWWVGLCGGVAGQEFHVWDLREQEPRRIYSGGSFLEEGDVPLLMSDPFAWYQRGGGRVSLTSSGYVVACTRFRIGAFSLQNPGNWLWMFPFADTCINSFSTCHNVCSLVTLEDNDQKLLVLDVTSGQRLGSHVLPYTRPITACMNTNFVLVSSILNMKVISYGNYAEENYEEVIIENFERSQITPGLMAASDRHVIMDMAYGGGGVKVMDFGLAPPYYFPLWW